VIANLFELAPVINSMKGGQIATSAISAATFETLKATFKTYLEDIFGMLPMKEQTSNKLDGVLSLLIEMRADAKKRKDFATSDQIRNKLAAAGVILKDEKDGTVSYTIE
jgi:cysteinyl-tRNA synthetase